MISRAVGPEIISFIRFFVSNGGTSMSKLAVCASLGRWVVFASITLAAPQVRGQLCTDPQFCGNWDVAVDWTGLPGGSEHGHAVHLMTGPHAGKLLIWFTQGNNSTYTSIWDPAPGSVSNLLRAGIVPNDMFCSSHTARFDGKILVNGGNPPLPGTSPLYLCKAVSAGPPQGTPPAWNPNATPLPERPNACWPCTEIRQSWLFDPNVVLPGGWSAMPLMNGSRYYPSQVALPGGLLPNLASGDPIVIGGTQDKACAVEELILPYWPLNPHFNGRRVDGHYLRGWEYPDATTGAWTEVGLPPSTPAYIGWPNWPTGPTPNTPYFRWFPQTFLLTDSKVFVAGDTHVDFVAIDTQPNPPNPASFTHWQVQNKLQSSYRIDVAASTITAVATCNDRFYSSAILMHTLTPTQPNRVLRFGGSRGDHNSSFPLGSGLASAFPSVEEWNDSSNVWVTKASLGIKRVFQNAVILPTREILIVGGSEQDYHNNDNQAPTPVLPCEIYDPQAGPTSLGSSTTVAWITRPRVYHSVAALLQDGRVASLGGHDVSGFPAAARSVQIYSPPYLFRGPRPVIASVTPSMSVQYGSTVSVVVKTDPTTQFDKVVLIRPASVSHHFDFDQRYVELLWSVQSISADAQTLNVVAPSGSHAPPGYYMLFVVQQTDLGPVPSVAATIQLGP